MNKKELVEKEIRELGENVISKLPATPDNYAYVKLYAVLKELWFQGNYELASAICEDVRSVL